MAEIRVGVLHAGEQFRQFRADAAARDAATADTIRQFRADVTSTAKATAETIETLATKEDVAAIQTALSKKDDWWKNGIMGPVIVGMILAGFELWLKHSP